MTALFLHTGMVRRGHNLAIAISGMISTVVEFDRSALGVESVPVSYDVEKGAMRKFAEAIGDDDPIYSDEQARRPLASKPLSRHPRFCVPFARRNCPI